MHNTCVAAGANGLLGGWMATREASCDVNTNDRVVDGQKHIPKGIYSKATVLILILSIHRRTFVECAM